VSWHATPWPDVVRALGTDPQRGLTTADAQRRLRETGPNRLPARRPRSWVSRIGAHFAEFFVLLLLAAAAVSWLLGQRVDALAIALIVAVNIALGVAQEHRAEHALAALRTLAAPHAEVIRDGIPRRLPAADLVRGDLVVLTSGARVPADLRLVETHVLAVDESLLTGEAAAAGKEAEGSCAEDAPLAEQHTLAFLGTAVVSGRGRGVVIRTGAQTELGALAGAVDAAPPKRTPLTERLSALGRSLAVGAIALCALVFLAGRAHGRPAFEMFLIATSLAVAAVPEGLPAAVTVALALGVQRMARKRAIVRRLAAVEALGTVTVVCTDKTGTLTVNEMAVRRIEAAGQTIEVTGPGYAPSGEVRLRDGGDARDFRPLRALLEAAVLASDGGVVEEGGRWRPFGDPLEAALAAAAMKAGLDPAALARTAPRVGETPFTPERKRMLTAHRTATGLAAYAKGAAEAIVPFCTARVGGAGEEPLDDPARAALLARAEAMAAEGMRVVAIARLVLPPDARGPGDLFDAPDRSAVFLGFVGLVDPVRPEARAAIAAAREAGVRVLMISGDHPRTALAVAREVGLDDSGTALTGPDLDRLSDAAMTDAIRTCSVFARATPQHKVRILGALRGAGEIVAMTGDGANDAPALAEADVGVAMGRGGTDVARGAADLVLTDDHFATIVAAIGEGRTIFENIRKFVLFVLASNVGEVAVVLAATLAGAAAVLTPIQILWINLVTDGLPSAALAVDPQDPAVMHRPPRPARQSPFAAGGLTAVLAFGLVIAAACGAADLWGMVRGESGTQRRTLVFLTLALSQLIFAFSCRSADRPVTGREFAANRWLLGAVTLSIALQVLVVTAPGLRTVFSATPLGRGDWVAVAGLSWVPFLVSERFKTIRRHRRRRC